MDNHNADCPLSYPPSQTDLRPLPSPPLPLPRRHSLVVHEHVAALEVPVDHGWLRAVVQEGQAPGCVERQLHALGPIELRHVAAEMLLEPTCERTHQTGGRWNTYQTCDQGLGILHLEQRFVVCSTSSSVTASAHLCTNPLLSNRRNNKC